MNGALSGVQRTPLSQFQMPQSRTSGTAVVLEQRCAARTQAQVSVPLATEPAQRPHEGLRAWSCVAEFTKSNYKSINSATKHVMSTGLVPCTCLRCALIFLFYFLYQDKKWRKRKRIHHNRIFAIKSSVVFGEHILSSVPDAAGRTSGTAVRCENSSSG